VACLTTKVERSEFEDQFENPVSNFKEDRQRLYGVRFSFVLPDHHIVLQSLSRAQRRTLRTRTLAPEYSHLSVIKMENRAEEDSLDCKEQAHLLSL